MHFQLGEQSKVFSIDVSLPTAKSDPPAEPAIAQYRADGIPAFVQHSGDIEGLVTEVLVIDRPAGSKDLVTHHPAVDLSFIETKRGDVQSGGLDPAVKLEVMPQKRRRI